jgi:hypothetical protein
MNDRVHRAGGIGGMIVTNRFNRFCRGMVSILSAGFLFQAASCSLDPTTVASGLATSVANSVISTFVFNAFGLGGP